MGVPMAERKRAAKQPGHGEEVQIRPQVSPGTVTQYVNHITVKHRASPYGWGEMMPNFWQVPGYVDADAKEQDALLVGSFVMPAEFVYEFAKRMSEKLAPGMEKGDGSEHA